MERGDSRDPGASRARSVWLALTLACSWPAATGCTPVAEPSELPTVQGEADWNSGAVLWRPYEEGLEAARAEDKPLILIFYTDWCPHCHNYSRVFHDPRLVELSRRFVMVRIERDSHPELSSLYDLDGQYIPRTFFLGADGRVLRDLSSGHARYRYFLDEHEPDELLGLMQRALQISGDDRR